MKILLLHAEAFSYETRKKAIKNPPDPPGSWECTNCLVVYTSIEEDDNAHSVMEAVDSIMDVASRVKPETVVVYPYAHLSSNLAPPRQAHSMLVELEKTLAGKGVKVHRAPFGWYKRFSITVYGHPLSELSRQIESDPLLYNMGGDTITLREAIEKGLIPREIAMPFINGEIEEILDRLGILPALGPRLIVESSIITRLLGGSLISASITNMTGRPPSTGLDATRLLLKACREGQPPSIVNTPGGAVMVLGGTSNPTQLYRFEEQELEDIKIGENGIYVPGISDGAVKLYRSRTGALIPIEANIGDKTCVGPFIPLIAAIVDNEIGKSEKDNTYTPMIPVWMHPIQVAIIPVKEEQIEYANTLATTLARYNIRVATLRDTSSRIGARIRKAARLWIPIIVVIGEREASQGVYTVRRRWEPGSQEVLTLDELVNEILNSIGGTPVYTL